MDMPFKLPLRVGSTYIEDATGFPVCSAGGNADATKAIVAAVNAFYTPPSAAQVKRWPDRAEWPAGDWPDYERAMKEAALDRLRVAVKALTAIRKEADSRELASTAWFAGKANVALIEIGDIP